MNGVCWWYLGGCKQIINNKRNMLTEKPGAITAEMDAKAKGMKRNRVQFQTKENKLRQRLCPPGVLKYWYREPKGDWQDNARKVRRH